MITLDEEQLKNGLLLRYRYAITKRNNYPPLVLKIEVIEQRLKNYLLLDVDKPKTVIAATFNINNLIKVNSIHD